MGSIAVTAPVARLSHNVYVVELSTEVLRERKFRARNPGYVEGKPCVYVGMTGLTPQQRFENHKAGVKAASVVRRYGLELAYEWFDEIPPMTWADAAQCEPTLADELRDRGFVVFGPTNRPPAPPPPRARRRAHKKR